MRNRLYALFEWVGDVFWVIPALLSLTGVLLAEGALRLETPGIDPLPQALIFADSSAGARNLLGTIAGSAIGVAGTIFSITIAALSLTSGQMGPRLLRNFLRDTGNKWALGLFLMTFAYCIELQRGMGAPDTASVPHLGIVLAVALALLCTVLLAWFVHHVASGINVETVISLVQEELMSACKRLTTDEALPTRAAAGRTTADRRGGALCRHRLPAGDRPWRAGRLGGREGCAADRAGAAGGLPASLQARRRGSAVGTGRRGRRGAARCDVARPAAGRRAGPGIRGAPAGRGRGARALPGHQRPLHRHGRAGPAGRGALRPQRAIPAQRGVAARRGRRAVPAPHDL